MSRIKRFYEDISEQVSNAIYEECMDSAEYVDCTRIEVYESVWTALIDGDSEYLIEYMTDILDCSDEPANEYPKTSEALRILGEAMEWRLL